MPTYRYRARTKTGHAERGVIEAASEDDAAALLQNRELIITALVPGAPAAGAPAVGPRPPTGARPVRVARRRRVTTGDLVTLSRSLATMLDSGLPLLKSLEVMLPQTQSRALQTALQTVIQDVRSGSTFRDAVAKHPKVFSKLWVSLIETGEASGQLTKALEQIAIHLEKAGAIQRKIASAMVYPSILLAVSFLAILIFTLKIIPTFSRVFQDFHAELPLITRIVVTGSDLLRAHAITGALLMGILGILGWRYAQTPPGKWQFDGLFLRLPVVGQLVQGAAVATFATALGTMVKAGVPLLHALEITIASTTNTRIAQVLEQVRSGAREGRPLAEPLRASEVFPPMVAQMIAVGEETGKLAGMLDEIAKFYEEEVNTLVQRLTALLEPALLLTMGTIIGILVIAMYMPIFQLSQSIRG